jgi:hypothetical protein
MPPTSFSADRRSTSTVQLRQRIYVLCLYFGFLACKVESADWEPILDQPISPEPQTTVSNAQTDRTVVFVSKATPGDDEFVLWLAPKLEAAGYTVFADILSLEAGDRWRGIVTSTLQTSSVKMLLCCSNETLAAPGVLEEIDIATDLSKELNDPRFILPLRIRPYKKIFGIAGLQYTDFVRGWAEGLEKLLASLKRQKVPCNAEAGVINPTWEIYRRRQAITLKNEPERLTSNWLRILEVPDFINFFEPTGAIDRDALAHACPDSPFPITPMQTGLVTFLSEHELNEILSNIGRFKLGYAVSVASFVSEGIEAAGIRRKDAWNVVHSMLRHAWNQFCRTRGLLEYRYAKADGFHIDNRLTALGQRIPWGRQGERRSSMLRNVAKGNVWQFGISASPAFWPFPHFKLKSRVLFAPVLGDDAGDPFDDSKKQHRLRRSICKGWRNKQWHGRLRAFVELVSGEQSSITLALGPASFVRVEAAPLLFSSPVSTILPNLLAEDDEEEDQSTLGRPEPEEEGET